MNLFTIRAYRLEDIDEVYADANESRDHIAKWMGWMTPEYCHEDAATWVKRAVDS